MDLAAAERSGDPPQRPWWPLLIVAVCALFGLRALTLAEATSLWIDELTTVQQVFQPSFDVLKQSLRIDSHPPLYYGLLWLYGHVVPQTTGGLRLLSWLAYVAGGLALVGHGRGLAVALGSPAPGVAAAAAALLAFCLPQPLRFSIEGRSYALLALLVTLALWARRCLLTDTPLQPRRPWLWLGCPLALALAALTHYYGLFALIGLALGDAAIALGRAGGRGRRLALFGVELVAAVPVLGWILPQRRFLVGGSTVDWLGPPDGQLLHDLLAAYLGSFPGLKLLLIGAGLLLLIRSGRLLALAGPGAGAAGSAGGTPPGWLDLSGLLGGLVMTALVVGVSFVRPLAHARYFIVLMPAVVSCLALGIAQLRPRDRRTRTILVAALAAALILSWQESFAVLDPAGAARGSREGCDFRTLSLVTASEPLRFTTRARRHLQSSDQVLIAAGRLDGRAAPWRKADELDGLLNGKESALPGRLALAATGDPEHRRLFDDARRRLEAAGYRCRDLLPGHAQAWIVRCERS